ncbi:MAG: hypothetical protein AB7P31_02870 [Steroidobacteraceae bacterium]
MTSAGLLGAAAPLLGKAQALPCPPPQLATDGSSSAATACTPSTMPAYIASMAPYQVRSLGGSYAPANGTSTLQSVMPAKWAGDDDIMRPWSGGAKSSNGSKMYVHGGGHKDSSNNGLYSFDFAGTSRPTGWTVENAGQTGVTSDFSVGSSGTPLSVHTYDAMVDMGASLYRFGGSSHPNGFFTSQVLRYNKANSVWTRLPNWPGDASGGSAIANAAAGKILLMDRWVNYNTYAFYRVATNNWSAEKQVASQWPDDFAAAYSPLSNVGVAIGGGGAFSFKIDWSAETIVQTSRSLPSGGGPALLWDPTRDVFWCFGASGNNSKLYEINPATFAVTTHNLTGDAPLTPESDSRGTYGRWVFMDSWRAIGSVASRSSPAFIIRLP